MEAGKELGKNIPDMPSFLRETGKELKHNITKEEKAILGVLQKVVKETDESEHVPAISAKVTYLLFLRTHLQSQVDEKTNAPEDVVVSKVIDAVGDTIKALRKIQSDKEREHNIEAQKSKAEPSEPSKS